MGDVAYGDELVKQFWLKVDKTTNTKGCWLWLGRKNVQGYGYINNGKDSNGHELAHRMSWDMAHPDEQSKGFSILHFECDNPACVNPAHLRRGSRRENNRDATVKGRAVIKTAEFSSEPLIVDENIAEPGDDIARLMAEVIPQVDIPARRVATEKAFRERDALVCALTKLLPSHLMRSPELDPSFGPDWQWVVCVHTSQGQVAWRIHNAQLPHYGHLERLSENHWDGHNTKEKYERLGALKPSWKKKTI